MANTQDITKPSTALGHQSSFNRDMSSDLSDVGAESQGRFRNLLNQGQGRFREVAGRSNQFITSNAWLSLGSIAAIGLISGYFLGRRNRSPIDIDLD